jgi:hypothetical protein
MAGRANFKVQRDLTILQKHDPKNKDQGEAWETQFVGYDAQSVKELADYWNRTRSETELQRGVKWRTLKVQEVYFRTPQPVKLEVELDLFEDQSIMTLTQHLVAGAARSGTNVKVTRTDNETTQQAKTGWNLIRKESASDPKEKHVFVCDFSDLAAARNIRNLLMNNIYGEGEWENATELWGAEYYLETKAKF